MLLSIAPTEDVIAAAMQNTGFDISARVMKEMARAERKPVLQKRKFLRIAPPEKVNGGQILVTDCIWLPARQLLWYACTMVDDQSAESRHFSQDPTFLPSKEFLLEVLVRGGKWTMRDRAFGVLPMLSNLLVPLRERKE